MEENRTQKNSPDHLIKKRKNTNIEHKDKKIKTNFSSIDAYTKHKILMNQYVLNKPGFSFPKFETQTDLDVLIENHRFIWDSDSEEEETDDNKKKLTWGQRLAKKYYDHLFKEYCICDLSKYKENKIAMKWRTEKEVILGKGQFICGNKICEIKDNLKTWEVNFGYMEKNEKKNALVKLRLCPKCSSKLNYYHKKKEIFSKNIEENEVSQKVDDFLKSLLV